MKIENCVLHVDGDAFFVGCELTRRPELVGLPVVTGGPAQPGGRSGRERGIASAMSYEAKALGITRGMPVFQIRQKFPQVVVLGSDFELYEHMANRMYEIVRRHSTCVEEYSIDECFSLISSAKGNPAQELEEEKDIATKIKRELQTELGMTFGVGLAPTKVLAKLASKRDKPNGLVLTDASNFARELYDMKIEKIWGAGPRTCALLRAYGVDTVGKFATLPESFLHQHFASPIHDLWLEVRGVSVLGVGTGDERKHSTSSRPDGTPRGKRKSIQKTRTFHPNTSDSNILFSHLAKNIENACTYARALGLATGVVNIFILTSDFKYRGVDIKLASFTSSPEDILPTARKMLSTLMRPGEVYRKTGVTLLGLTKAKLSGSVQDLFGDYIKSNNQQELYKTVDNINEEWGGRVLALASTMQARKAHTDVQSLRGQTPQLTKLPNLPSMGSVW